MSDQASRALRIVACFSSALIALFISGAVSNAQGQPSQEQPSQEQQPQQTPTTVPVPTSPKPAAAVAGWQQAVVARLVRFQRYPAQAKGATGVVNLSFSIDRQGHVLNRRVIKSSGSAVLDTEALSLLTRAAPLPPPPSAVPDSDLTFVLPVRFVLK
jgi:periplasmic protein TonB